MVKGSPTKGRIEMNVVKEQTFNPVRADEFHIEVDPGRQWVKVIFEASGTRLIFQFPGSDFWDWLEGLSEQAGERED